MVEDVQEYKKGKNIKIDKEKVYHNYKDFTEDLNFSDHSPVSAGFTIAVPVYNDIK